LKIIKSFVLILISLFILTSCNKNTNDTNELDTSNPEYKI